jgi:hypothetical protein
MRARVLAVFLVWPAIAGAQLATPAATEAGVKTTPVGFALGHAVSPDRPAIGQRMMDGGPPRWVKWGLIGAAGGGVLFAIAGQSSVDKQRHSVAGDFAFGAGTGFVLVGSGVWFYDLVCSRGSRSRAAGLCGR